MSIFLMLPHPPKETRKFTKKKNIITTIHRIQAYHLWLFLCLIY